MNIQEMRDTYYEASGKASDISRQLAFAGIAVIWVLKIGTKSGGIPFSEELITPLYCFVIALAFDLLQYLYKSIIWGSLNHFYWKKHLDNEVDIEISGLINMPTNIFFWTKISVVSYGFILLLFFIHSKL